MRPRLALATLIVAALLAGCGADNASARRSMEIGLQDDSVFLQGREYALKFGLERALRRARSLGVTRLRVNLTWAYALGLQRAARTRKPRRPRYDFERQDRLIDEAARYGMRVHLALTGPAPAWATSNRRVGPRRPNPRRFAEFVRTAVRHFAGRVDRYSIWNEPNWVGWLAPLEAGPRLYRTLYLAGYKEVKREDPEAQVLIGETAPYAQPGRATAPLKFLRELTCRRPDYRRARRCAPLEADGYAHHPYDFLHSPDYRFPGRDNATIGTLGRLTTALDRLAKAGALRPPDGEKMPVYLTEHGYFASGRRALPAGRAARYLVRSFDIALRNERVHSMLQYLLLSPPRDDPGAFFDTGLLSTRGRAYEQFRALQRWARRPATRRLTKRPGRKVKLPPRSD